MNKELQEQIEDEQFIEELIDYISINIKNNENLFEVPAFYGEKFKSNKKLISAYSSYKLACNKIGFEPIEEVEEVLNFVSSLLKSKEDEFKKIISDFEKLADFNSVDNFIQNLKKGR